MCTLPSVMNKRMLGFHKSSHAHCHTAKQLRERYGFHWETKRGKIIKRNVAMQHRVFIQTTRHALLCTNTVESIPNVKKVMNNHSIYSADGDGWAVICRWSAFRTWQRERAVWVQLSFCRERDTGKKKRSFFYDTHAKEITNRKVIWNHIRLERLRKQQ